MTTEKDIRETFEVIAELRREDQFPGIDFSWFNVDFAEWVDDHDPIRSVPGVLYFSHIKALLVLITGLTNRVEELESNEVQINIDALEEANERP